MHRNESVIYIIAMITVMQVQFDFLGPDTV